MGPAALLCLFVWTHTLLPTSGSSEVSVNPEFAPDFTSQPIRRHKRQYSTDEKIPDVTYRINNIEDIVIKSRKDVQEVLGYLNALGVSANNGHLPKLRDPCGNGNGLEGSNQLNWTRFGTSKCVKLIEEQSNFTNANAVCREHYRIGEDIARPVVVSLDSSQKAMDLLATLSLQGTSVTSVWINRANGSMCPELRVPDTNLTVEGLDFKMVQCGRVNSVVCEKPVIASFVEIVEQQFEMRAETRKFEKQFKEAQDVITHLREEISEEKRLKTESDKKTDMMLASVTRLKSLVATLSVRVEKSDEELKKLEIKMEANNAQSSNEQDRKIQTIVEALRSEFNSKFSQLELKSTTNDSKLAELRRQEEKSGVERRKLKAEVKRLERKLEELRVTTEAKEMLRTTESVEQRRLLSNLETDTSTRVSNLERRQVAAETEAVEIKERVEAIETKGEEVLGNLTDVRSVVASLGIWRRQTETQMRTEKAILAGLVEEVNQMNSTKEASLEKLQVAVTKVGEWELGGHRPFILQKIVGVWYWIETFHRNSKPILIVKCSEAEISINGNNTFDYRHRDKIGSSDEITSTSFTRTVDTQSPHLWKIEGTFKTLSLKTDYDNWWIEGSCVSNDISSCYALHIYSRTRTLPAGTLEVLRGSVEKFGFSKTNNLLIDQTSC